MIGDVSRAEHIYIVCGYNLSNYNNKSRILEIHIGKINEKAL